jgi:hypothetical protein
MEHVSEEEFLRCTSWAKFSVCLVPHFIQKNLGFAPSFYRMELNTMQNFWQKCIHSPFWILASRKKSQKAKKNPHPTS